MEELYRGKHLPVHAQVMLVDAEDPQRWPEWKTGEEEVLFGPTGIIVATAPSIGHTYIDIIVSRGNTQAVALPGVSGQIRVGREGLLAGAEVADVVHLAWPPGPTFVSVHVNGSRDQITQVHFVLESIDSYEQGVSTAQEQLAHHLSRSNDAFITFSSDPSLRLRWANSAEG